MVDILLVVAFAVLQLAMAGLGVYVSLKPQPPERHRAFIGTFLSLAILAIFVGIVQQVRAGHEQKILQGTLDTLTQQDTSISQKIDKFTPMITPQKVIGSVPMITSQPTTNKPISGRIPREGNQENQPPIPEHTEDDQKLIEQLKGIVASNKPWGLSPDQLVTLTRAMSVFANSKERGDLITDLMTDPDSQKFGNQLVGAFRAAGWNLPGSGINMAVYNGPMSGIIVVVASRDANPPGLSQFVGVMRSAGIQVSGQINPKQDPNEFSIIVGSKPD